MANGVQDPQNQPQTGGGLLNRLGVRRHPVASTVLTGLAGAATALGIYSQNAALRQENESLRSNLKGTEQMIHDVGEMQRQQTEYRDMNYTVKRGDNLTTIVTSQYLDSKNITSAQKNHLQYNLGLKPNATLPVGTTVYLNFNFGDKRQLIPYTSMEGETYNAVVERAVGDLVKSVKVTHMRKAHTHTAPEDTYSTMTRGEAASRGLPIQKIFIKGDADVQRYISDPEFRDSRRVLAVAPDGLEEDIIYPGDTVVLPGKRELVPSNTATSQYRGNTEKSQSARPSNTPQKVSTLDQRLLGTNASNLGQSINDQTLKNAYMQVAQRYAA